jgi:tetrahydromethanopterin S-methyltransferase subunit E
MKSESSDIYQSSISSDMNHDYVDLAKIKLFKIFQIIIGVCILNLIFGTFSYFFLYGEISNAKDYIDYIYFGSVSLSTAGYGDMAPTTSKARIVVSVYLLFLYAFMLSLAL